MKSIVEIIGEEIQNNQNFQQWFGQSKVVDRSGKPLKVYHGTQADFDKFESSSGLIYFSRTPKYASAFATNPNIKGAVMSSPKSVMPVYLSIQKPLDLTEFKTDIVSRYEFGGKLDDLGIEINSDDLKDYPMGFNIGEDVKVWQWLLFNSKYLLPVIKSTGFDGIFMYENADTGNGREIKDIAYVVFDSTQVKSASGNNGEYDKNNPNILKEIIWEEISNYNKSKFIELPQDLFDRLKMRKFSDEANRSHMKIYKAKDGKYFIISKDINQDVFKARDLDGNQVGVAVFDDDKPDYFTGYESSQSIKVEPQYQRIGIATALTDFAETIYNKPYKPTKLLSEPMQGFVKNRFVNENTGETNTEGRIEKGTEGDCYKNVQDYLLDNDIPDAVIIHGEVTSKGKTVKHSWIETPTMVYDPTTGIKTSKEKYYQILNPHVDAQYDFPQAMKKRFSAGNYGPWSE